MVYNFDASVLPVINRIYYATRNNSWTIVEPDNVFIYILEGSCIFDIDGNIFNADKNSTVFIPANLSYTRSPYNNEPCTFIYIHFTIDTDIKELDNKDTMDLIALLRQHWNNSLMNYDSNYNDNFNELQFFVSNNFHLSEADSKDILPCIDSLIEHIKHPMLESKLFISILLWRIFSILTHNVITLLWDVSESQSVHSIPRELKQIISYIKNNYNQQLTIESLCNYSHLSKQQLIRTFKKYMHTTPISYILDYKICVAKALLLSDSNLSVKEIAMETGFPDQHYFSRIFKKKTGFSPLAYKTDKQMQDNILYDNM